MKPRGKHEQVYAGRYYMICPSCGNNFRGGQFYSVGGGRSETMRKCPCGHTFKEPPRTPTKAEMIRRAAPDMHKVCEGLERWWRLPNAERTIEAIEQVIRDALEALAKADGK